MNTARDIFHLLTSEDDEAGLYDRTLTGFGEGFDAYVERAYLWRDEEIFLFREHESAQPIGSEVRAIAAAAKAAHEAYNSAQ